MKTTGLRKFLLGLAYLGSVTSISLYEIHSHAEPGLVGLAALATGIATGVGAVMWGNAKEHQAKTKGEPAP